MNVAAAILAGLGGTAALVVIELLFPRISRVEFDLVRVAADQSAFTTRYRLLLTFTIPFVVGSLFGLLYAWLWEQGFGRPSWEWAVVLGAIHGAVVIAISPLARRLDTEGRLGSPSDPVWMAGEIIDHMVYAVVAAWIYATLTLSFF